MAVDGTSIKNDIDNDLANKGYRGIRIATIITTLKKLVDWVASAVANNVSTWLRSSDNLPGGANNEGIYRTGAVSVTGGFFAKVFQGGTGPALNQQGFGTAGIQVVSIGPGSASFMEFHVQGVVVHQFGVDSDQLLKFRPFTSGVAYPVVIDGVTSAFALKAETGYRKIVLFDVGNNPHQHYGFGIDPLGLLRYQVADANNDHVFYAGLTPATSRELLRIKGSGRVEVGGPITVRLSGNTTLDSGQGFGIQHAGYDGDQRAITIGALANGKAFIRLVGSGTGILASLGFYLGNTEVMTLSNSGNLGINQANPTSKVHITGANGYQQLRLENSYTPTGVNDPNGAVGDTAWDANYFYIKSAGGWRRTAITGW